MESAHFVATFCLCLCFCIQAVQDLEYLPTPVLIGLVPGEVVEVEKALDRLGPQQVVGVVWLHIEVLCVQKLSKLDHRYHHHNQSTVRVTVG